MQKADLYQHIILSFAEHLEAFGHNDQHATGMIANAGDLAHYQTADIQLVVATIRPYVVDQEDNTISYDSEQLIQYWKAYEELRKQNTIPVVLDKVQLADTKYTDFALHLVYHLTGCDGVQAIADIENFYKGGIRVIQPVWEYDNTIAHCHRNTENKGLTDFGKECVTRMNEHHMLIDTANMNQQSMMDVYQFTKKPILNSHTNIKALYNHSRNVSDDFLELVGESGGVIGLSLESSCMSGSDDGATLDDYLAQIQYVRDRIGNDHVAMGSGYHGLFYKKIITGYEKIESVGQIEQAVVEKFGEKFASQFFWDNAYRVLLQGL